MSCAKYVKKLFGLAIFCAYLLRISFARPQDAVKLDGVFLFPLQVRDPTHERLIKKSKSRMQQQQQMQLQQQQQQQQPQTSSSQHSTPGSSPAKRGIRGE